MTNLLKTSLKWIQIKQNINTCLFVKSITAEQDGDDAYLLNNEGSLRPNDNVNEIEVTISNFPHRDLFCSAVSHPLCQSWNALNIVHKTFFIKCVELV